MKDLQKSSMMALSFMAKDQDALAPGIISLASASAKNTRPDKTMGGRNAKANITAKPAPRSRSVSPGPPPKHHWQFFS
jgi:hypothetical protein